MSPVKVYSDIPLHADGVTPKTAEPENDVEAQPTRTTNLPPADTSVPPPPQPGAVPQPPAPTPTAGVSSVVPPPPRAGHSPRPSITTTHVTTTTGQLPQPHQMSIAPPSPNQLPTHSTYVPPTSPFEGGFKLPPMATGGGFHQRRPSLHPPGYQQNPYAADGTPDDRARWEETARRQREEEGIVGTVMNALSGAGRRLSVLEDEAWKWAKGGRT